MSDLRTRLALLEHPGLTIASQLANSYHELLEYVRTSANLESLLTTAQRVLVERLAVGRQL